MIKCFACESSFIKSQIQVDRFRIANCGVCGTGRVDISSEPMSYIDYGEFLTQFSEDYVRGRVRPKFLKKCVFLILKAVFGKRLVLLDLGGGAGYFAKSAQNCGVANVILVEPSDHLRRFAVEEVGLDASDVLEDLSGVASESVDVVSMLDVIEHIPEDAQLSVLGEVHRILKPGGVIIGKTPNYRSLNLLLGGARDPVIAPPSHCIYFTRNGLAALFRSNGWRVKALFCFGLSHNLFFRPNKTTASWVENPKGFFTGMASKVIRLSFSVGGVFAIFGGGYHLAFVTKKPLSVGTVSEGSKGSHL